MAMTKEERLQIVHEEAIREFEKIQSASRDERLQCLQDRRFYSISGAQWEGPLGVQFENKPRFEVNKIHLAVIRIINEYRNNRISVSFVSKDGTDADQLADTCASLYRADEQDSAAEEAYDNAFEEAVGGGFGAWRLRACYEDEDDDDNDNQRVRIEPIFDADSSVFFDLNAKRQDKADAARCYVLTAMTRDAYKDEYGEDIPASIPKQIHQRQFDWLTPDVVYVAEYYKIEKKNETVYSYRDVTGDNLEKYTDEDFENDETLKDTLDATGWQLVMQKKVKRCRCHKYIINGVKVLEDCGYIAGRYIPIIPVFGKRWFIDNTERMMGHVRLAKDVQRLKNMQLSKIAEIAASSSTKKPIFAPEQIAGHQQAWADDNIKNYPYLQVNPMTDGNGSVIATGPTSYLEPPEVPPAMAALLQITEQDMADLLGNQQQADKLVSNIATETVNMIQERLDMQTFIYVSNFAKAIKRSGEVWLSMAREIFIESGRKMKGISDSGSTESIELKKPMMGAGGSGMMLTNDLSKANFDIAVEVGPSSSSKRKATVDQLQKIMTSIQDQETLSVLSALVMMNQDGEGLSDTRDYFRKKLLNLGAVKPTQQEQMEMAQAAQNAANQPPDAQTQYLQAAAQQAQAAAVRDRSNTLLTLAKTDNTKADTLGKMAEIDLKERQHALEVFAQMNDNSNALGGQAPAVAPQAGEMPAQPQSGYTQPPQSE
jgi:hypothetical protein